MKELIMKKLVVVFCFLLLSASVFGQVIKIASVAPETTPWGVGLNRLASEWSRISNGRVRVTIFHGGIGGSESDTVRKMRLGQLQGVSVSPVGLGSMLPDIWGMMIPGVLQSTEELDYVLENTSEELNEEFRNAGYEILTWSNAGWMRFFSSAEVRTPDDLRDIRVGATDFPEEFLGVLRNIGMQPVSTTASETLSALNSGLLNTVIYVPLGVAGFQWFAVADKMTDIQVTPLFGAIAIDSRAWRRIPEQYHEEFKEVAQRIGREIEEDLDALERNAIEQMISFGLEIIETSEAEKNSWQRIFESARADLQDQFFSVPIIQQVQQTAEEYRSR